MSILGFHHIHITVPEGGDMLAKHYYCELLELPRVERPAESEEIEGFWVQIGGKAMHIGKEIGINRPTTKIQLAYLVSDLKHWQNRLEGEGYVILEVPPVPGFARFESYDPFGNRTEFIQEI